VRGRHTLGGLLVDPIDGARTGKLVLDGGNLAAVEDDPEAPATPLLFPGLVDLQVYELDERLRPLETVVSGKTVRGVRYPQTQRVGRNPA
jgi:dihydroorotase-like cyclic amidohydrolase